jgi:hypothetical protein
MLAIDLLLTTDAQNGTVIAIAMGAATAGSTMMLWLLLEESSQPRCKHLSRGIVRAQLPVVATQPNRGLLPSESTVILSQALPPSVKLDSPQKPTSPNYAGMRKFSSSHPSITRHCVLLPLLSLAFRAPLVTSP